MTASRKISEKVWDEKAFPSRHYSGGFIFTYCYFYFFYFCVILMGPFTKDKTQNPKGSQSDMVLNHSYFH